MTTRIRRLHVKLLSGAAALALSATAALADGALLSLPEQPLAQSLKDVARATGVNILFTPDAVADVKARALKGQMTARIAVNALLAGSSLEVVADTSGGLIVRMKVAANVSRPADQQVAQAPDTVAASPPSVKSPGATPDEGTVEKVTVTGSRIRGRRADGPSPVITFDRKKIEEVGATSVPDVLRQLPQTSSTLPDAAGRTSPGGTLTVALRGLPDSATLVLIDGRRQQFGADARSGVNLNGIPLTAVERIEVLTDGASAIYGADAAAGVVNIILRKNFDGAEMGARYGNTLRSDSGETLGTAALGKKFGRLNFLLTGEAFDRNDLYGSDLRAPFRNYNFTSLGGIDQRVTRAATPGTIFAVSGNLPGVGAPRAILPVGQNGTGLTPASFLPTAGQQNLESRAAADNYVAGAERRHGMLRLNYEFDDGLSAFANFLYGDDTQLSRRPFFEISSATIPAANPFNPFGVNVRFSGAILHDDLPAALYRFTNTKESFSALAGVSKDFGNGWDFEVAAGYQIDDSQALSYTLNTTRLQTHLNTVTSPSSALNLFATVPFNATATMASFLDETKFDYSLETEFADAKLRGELFALPGGVVQAVVGGETFEHLYSASVLTIGDAKRSTTALFAEVNVPIVSEANALPFVNEITLNVAGRYDHYSDFGDAKNPKVSLIYRPTESVFFRGSWGTFFRAPTMADTYQPLVLAGFTATVTDPRRGNATTVAAFGAGGNADLDPEDGSVWNVGFGWRLKEWANLTTTIDFWSLDQQNVNGRVANQNLVNFEALFPQFVFRAPPSPADILLGQPGPITRIDSVPLNFGSRKTNGIDFQVQYALPTELGQFSTTILGTRTFSFEEALVPGLPAGQRLGRGNLGGTLYPSKWKGVATLSWTNKEWGASITGRYIGNVLDVNQTTFAIIRDIDATWTVDSSLSYSFGERRDWASGMTLRVGGQNIFDRTPEFFSQLSTGVNASRDDLRGRVLYIDVSKRF